jgi:hypothetical protein
VSKRPNLADITAAAGSTRRQPMPTAPPVTVPALEGEGRGAAPARPKARSGTKMVAGHFPEDVSWQLRQLGLEQRSSVQELLGEALNDLFQKYGKPELVPPRRKGLS